MLAEQLPLLGRGEARFDPQMNGLQRTDLDDRSWVDQLSGWVQGSERLLAELRATMAWRQDRRLMYDREVDVPRWTASLPRDGPPHTLIQRMATALGHRYQEPMDRVHLALYRDGRDSVAMHQDKVIQDWPESLVAIVSLGGPRRFVMRPLSGGPTRSFSLGWGDLLVMGGACQRRWEHGVPKMAYAQPRISILFRQPGHPPG
jgi:alkylated DNA repair dioxygenase AlkB